MDNVQPADPRARRAAFVLLGVGTIVGLIALSLARRFRPAFEAWVLADPPGRVWVVVAAMIVMISGPLLGFSIYLWRLGRSTIRVNRYPPPGLRLTRDVEVLTGSTAARRGHTLQTFSSVLAVLAVVAGLLLWSVMSSLTPRFR